MSPQVHAGLGLLWGGTVAGGGGSGEGRMGEYFWVCMRATAHASRGALLLTVDDWVGRRGWTKERDWKLGRGAAMVLRRWEGGRRVPDEHAPVAFVSLLSSFSVALAFTLVRLAVFLFSCSLEYRTVLGLDGSVPWRRQARRYNGWPSTSRERGTCSLQHQEVSSQLPPRGSCWLWRPE